MELEIFYLSIVPAQLCGPAELKLLPSCTKFCACFIFPDINVYMGCLNHILIISSYAQQPSFNTHADVSSRYRGLKFGTSLHLHPFFVYASIKTSSESVFVCSSLYCSTM